MNLFELYKEYVLPILSLFLIVWSIYGMVKDRRRGKPVAKKAIIAASVSIVIIAILSFIIISRN